MVLSCERDGFAGEAWRGFQRVFESEGFVERGIGVGVDEGDSGGLA